MEVGAIGQDQPRCSICKRIGHNPKDCWFKDGGKGAEVGVELAESTGKSVERLKRVIEDTASGSLEIEAAVRQEVVGIEQIAEALDQINSVTQGFTASTKQNTQAADQLVEIAGRLRASVEAYRTA